MAFAAKLSVLAVMLAGAGYAAEESSSPSIPKLPRQLNGQWENSDKCCFTGAIRITVESQAGDGAITGTYYRTTPDGQHCATRGEWVPMKGTFDGTKLVILPAVPQRFCEDTKFTFERKPSGSFEGTGYSWFNLKAYLEEKK